MPEVKLGLEADLGVALDPLIAEVPKFDEGADGKDGVGDAVFAEDIVPAEGHEEFADERLSVQPAMAAGGDGRVRIGVGVVEGIRCEGAEVVVGEAALSLAEVGQRAIDPVSEVIDGFAAWLGEQGGLSAPM